ncbi:hypothetical protein ACFP3I_07015 [Chryseobacterium arachidis]|uniref:hypothetical protein n=1 Tax=Chryseobacterium arachidis TaxID=1416778 RepID=UPI003619CECB
MVFFLYQFALLPKINITSYHEYYAYLSMFQYFVFISEVCSGANTIFYNQTHPSFWYQIKK